MAQAQPKHETPSVTVKKLIRAPRNKVYEAWTNPEIASKWFFPQHGESTTFSNDLRVGGSYRNIMTFKAGESGCGGGCSTEKSGEKSTSEQTGEYLELVPPEKIVFTWNTSGVQNSVVTVLLSEVNGATEVTITHALPHQDDIPPHQSGWTSCLENLGSFLA